MEFQRERASESEAAHPSNLRLSTNTYDLGSAEWSERVRNYLWNKSQYHLSVPRLTVNESAAWGKIEAGMAEVGHQFNRDLFVLKKVLNEAAKAEPTSLRAFAHSIEPFRIAQRYKDSKDFPKLRPACVDTQPVIPILAPLIGTDGQVAPDEMLRNAGRSVAYQHTISDLFDVLVTLDPTVISQGAEILARLREDEVDIYRLAEAFDGELTVLEDVRRRTKAAISYANTSEVVDHERLSELKAASATEASQWWQLFVRSARERKEG